MTEERFRQLIARGRRITRDEGLLAIIDELERRLNAPEPRPSIEFKGRHTPNLSKDAKIAKTRYMKFYMQRYRARKKAEKAAQI